MLATNMLHMYNNNPEIRFAGSSGRLQHAISESAQAFQSESNCETIDMKTIFYFHKNKMHFHKSGFLQVASFWKWERLELVNGPFEYALFSDVICDCWHVSAVS